MTEPIEARLEAAGLPPLPRHCWLEIDVAALAHNLGVVRSMIGAGVEINAVVKADAYGHGIEAAARAFVDAGADRLCVAALDEALHLRSVGVKAPLLVLFAVPAEHVALAAEAGIELTLAEEATARDALAGWRAARREGELAVHLEMETGLARAGLRADRVADVCREALATPGVRVAGLWSHLASPHDEAFTAGQLAEFERAVAALTSAGLPVPRRHLAASGGLLSGRVPAYEGVRPGLMLYGLAPEDLPLSADGVQAAASLRPAMALKCRPLRIEDVPAGTPVGYGGRWRAERPSRVATLPVGYGDGWSRSYQPGAQALVRGRRVPLVGTVAMDAVMIDVTDVPGVDLADEFVLLGRQGGEEITAGELARARNTISWEIVTTMAQRVPRVYHAPTVLLDVRTLGGELRKASGAVHRGEK
ncbi:MAG TPA: alanine racemase [Candidatus Limnocylindria bacterium]|nr:alanine racemase [Candidatus Limnocylindria bacterium]